MRIAMAGPFGLQPNRTMSSRALPLAMELVRRGHEVCMFMPPWQTPDEGDRQWVERGVSIRYTPVTGGSLAIGHRLRKEIVAWQPELVHTFKPKAYSGLVSWWLWHFRRDRLPLIVDSDDWEGKGGWNDLAPYSRLQKAFFAWQETWGIRHCHALTVASRELVDRALQLGVEPERLVYIPNGPGIGLPGTSRQAARKQLDLENRPTLLLYSRYFEFSIERLFSIIGLIKAQLGDLIVLAVGQPLYDSDRERIADLKNRHDLEDAWKEIGWVEPKLLPDLLSAADAGIYLMDDTLLNRSKCPVKLADMASVGLPVVGDNVGQVAEYIVDGQSGYLLSEASDQEAANALVRILDDSQLRDRLSAAASKHIAANFTWERHATVLEETYFKVCKQVERAGHGGG